MIMKQLSLFPDIVPHETIWDSHERVQRRLSARLPGYTEEEERMLWTIWSFRWLGAFLRGVFDARIAGPGNRITKVVFSFGYPTTYWLVARQGKGGKEVAVHREIDREKCVRGFMEAARSGRLHWKRDKYQD